MAKMLVILVILFQYLGLHGQDKTEIPRTLTEAVIFIENQQDSLTALEKSNKIFEVKKAWLSLTYYTENWKLLLEYNKRIDNLSNVADLRFKSGDMDYLEASSYYNRAIELKTLELKALNQIEICQNHLQTLLIIENPVIQTDSVLKLYEIDKSRAYSELESTLQPENHQTFEKQKILSNLCLELDNIFIEINYFTTFANNHAETLIQIAQSKLESEEIDYLEYAEIISKAYTIKLNYLSAINSYNQGALDIESYGY